MNKIYKVMYSKVKQCCVVVSEIAKSHGHNGESSGVRKHAALTAAVLIALGSLSFTTAFVPMTAEAATKTGGSNFVGVERTDGLLDDKEYDNYGGKGANGADSITLGLRAKAGEGTITIGDRNAGASLGSVYVGQGDIAKPKLDSGGWVTSIGYNSDATGYGSIALGSNAVARNSYAKDSKGESLDLNPNFRLNSKPDIQRASVAIGYGANADNGNIAIGSYSDASTDLRTAKTKDGKEIKSYLTDKMADSYVSVGDGKDHSETQYRRISNVADGAADSDAATIAQLKQAVVATDASKKANIDASNIGTNLKYKADGKTAADSSDKTTNEDAWGTAIGTGSIANSNTNGSGQLVTGTTVYNYVAPKAVAGKALQYISEDKSTGINLGILDDKVSTNATDITGLKSLSNITDNGKTVIKKAAVGAVKVTAGDRITVTPDSKNLTDADTVTYTISAKNDGKVASGNSDLVSGDTVYQALQNQTKSLTYTGGWGINIDSSKKISLKNNLTTVIDDGSESSKNVKFNIDDTAMAIGGAIFNNIDWGSYAAGKTMTIDSTGYYSVRLGGINNSTTGRYSTVTGGSANVASGYASSVNGGKNNTASGKYATVIGGGYLWTEATQNGDFPDVDESIFGSDASSKRNDASGILSTIIGGYGNKASGKNSLIVGGLYNEASNESASIFGGGSNRAAGDRTTISGGMENFAVGDYSNVSGGIASTTEGRFSTISGGYGNIIADEGPVQPNRKYYGFTASGVYGSAFGGGYNVVGGENGTAVGGGHSVVYGVRSVGLAGGSTGLGAHYALAAGYQSVVTTKGSKLLVSDKRNEFTDDYYYDNQGYAYKILGKRQNSKNIDFIPEYEDVATAVGYQATANEPDTISFGHDVGDVSGYDVKWKERTDKDKWGNINTNPDETINDYAQKPDIIINHYDTAKYNRLVKVADGINNHDVVVMEQLRNADNVGKNAKNNVVVYKENKDGTLQVDENGEAIIDVDASKAATEKATEQAIKDSEDAWGGALGTGKVEANNSQLVTGDTVYNAIQNQAEWKLTTNGESADKATAIKPGTTVNFSAEKRKDHSNVTISHNGSNVTIGLDKDIVLGDTSHSSGGSLNVYTDSSDGNNLSNHVSINGSTISVNYPKSNDDKKTPTDTRGVILGVGEEDSKPDGYIAFNNVEGAYTYLHASTDTSDDKKGRLEYVGSDGNKKYIANLDDVSTAVNNAKTKYYAVDENAPLMNLDTYKNEGNDGAKGMGSLAAGFVTHADGIASTVVGSYSGVIGSWLQGAAAVSVGTVNVNNNTDPNKIFSGVANSIVGQANMTTDSNAAIIVGAGNSVTNSYRELDKDALSAIKSAGSVSALKDALQAAVPKSGAQVMVMGGGNNVESAYMSQVVGVGNTVTGADSTYAEGTSTQYNFVDGFQNELTNGKNDYIIGSNNSVTGDHIDKNQSNIVVGDNHTLTNRKNNVVIGSADKKENKNKELTASDATVIGHNADVTVDGGVAIGSGSVSKATAEADAEGYDPISTATNKASTNTSATWKATTGAVSIGGGVNGNTTTTRRITNLAAGFNDTDAVNVAQIKKLASINASNIGANLKKDDGTAADATDITNNKKDWAEAIGTGTVTKDDDGSKQMVTGKTVYDALHGGLDNITVGKDGKDGKDGSIGIAGKDGKNGYTMTIIKTEQGAAGVDGKDGITRVVYQDKDGNGKHTFATLDDGLKFKGDDSTIIAKKLNEQLNITGGADSTKLTDKNIGVNSSTDGLKIQLAKNLAGITSIANQTTTGKGDAQTTTGAKIDLKDDGSISVNSGKITDVKSGLTATDGTYADTDKNNAANIGDVHSMIEKEAGNTDDKLALKANVAADNIGTHITDTTAQKTNLDNWGAAIGTGAVADSTNEHANQLVTGKTVYDALHGGLDNITVGKDGQNGKDGSIGIAGQNGKDGYSITYIKTEQGAAGVDGKDGITRVVYQDKDGNGKHTFATLDDGLKFKGDDSTIIAKKLNEQLNITGGADSTKLTDKNIGVNSSTDGLKIQLAKNLAGITSIANQTTTGKGDAQTTTGAKIDLKDDGSISVNSGKITDVKSGLTATDGTYADTDKNNAANIGDVHSMIEKEAGNTDDKLALKANVAADNIGTHITDTTAQKTNLDNWGEAIGTGKIADPDASDKETNGSKQLVTGGTVYNEVRPSKDGKYVKIAQTTGANLIALDDQVKQNAQNISDNTYAQGDGILMDKTKKTISVNKGDGLKFTEDHKLAVYTGNGLKIDNGAVAIKTSDSNLKVDSNGIGLSDKITIGSDKTKQVTIDGTKGEISGLTNTTWDSKADYSKSTKAATESQVDAAVKDAVKQAGENDIHVAAGSYAVNDQNQVSMNLVDKNNDTKGTVIITDVAKSSEMGDVSKLADGVKNAGGKTTTVVDAINNVNTSMNTKIGDQNYSTSNTSGSNKYVQDGDSITSAIGKLDGAVQQATTAAGQHSTVSAGSNITVTPAKQTDGHTDYQVALNKDITVNSVTAKTATTDTLTVNNSATIGGVTIANKTISGLDDTKIEKGSTNAVNAGTIWNELRPSGGTYINQNNTTAQNLTSLDTQVKKTSDLINSDGKTIKIGGSDAATKIDVNGNDGKGRVITGVVSDANDPTSAANVGYVNGVTAANTQQIYRDMNNAYGRLNNNINKAAAGSNALAALHPLDYDPDDKADFAVGYGHYRNANAAAVGAFYHPNENTMVNVGVSLGNGDPGFNAGVSFKVGRGGAGREAMSKTEMAKVINSQSKEIDALKKDNADKDKRIDALEQKMAEILAKLDKNGK